MTAPAPEPRPRSSLLTQKPIVEEIVRFAVEEPEQFELITEIVAQKASERRSSRHSRDYLEGLLARHADLQDTHVFQSGDLVTWKEGLKNRRRPDYGEPAVVVDVVDPAIMNPRDDSRSAYFREPLDVALGMLDEDGELIVYHFDSRRLRPLDNTGAGS